MPARLSMLRNNLCCAAVCTLVPHLLWSLEDTLADWMPFQTGWDKLVRVGSIQLQGRVLAPQLVCI